jgi:hypothetical protein
MATPEQDKSGCLDDVAIPDQIGDNIDNKYIFSRAGGRAVAYSPKSNSQNPI